jgi:hypothetical protein
MLTTNGKTVSVAAPSAGATAAFMFPPLAPGVSYQVMVSAQPTHPWQTCEVTGTTGTGTIGSADLDTVRIKCTTSRLAVGGSVDWLRAGESIELSLNDGARLSVTKSGMFSFGPGTEVTSGASYAVAVTRQPPGQDCQITHGSGAIAGSAITDVTVTCRCFTVARIAVDRRWAQWKLPGTPGNLRSYSATADTVVDCVTGLEWQRVVPATAFTQADAVTYCDGLTLADQSDWRLPTAIELVSVLDDNPERPPIDAAAFPNTPGERFWTAAPVAGDPDHGWTINFNGGLLRHDTPVTSMNRVRCVR